MTDGLPDHGPWFSVLVFLFGVVVTVQVFVGGTITGRSDPVVGGLAILYAVYDLTRRATTG